MTNECNSTIHSLSTTLLVGMGYQVCPIVVLGKVLAILRFRQSNERALLDAPMSEKYSEKADEPDGGTEQRTRSSGERFGVDLLPAERSNTTRNSPTSRNEPHAPSSSSYTTPLCGTSESGESRLTQPAPRESLLCGSVAAGTRQSLHAFGASTLRFTDFLAQSHVSESTRNRFSWASFARTVPSNLSLRGASSNFGILSRPQSH